MDWHEKEVERFKGVCEGCLGGILLGLIVLLFLMLSFGCRTSCPSKIETVEVKVPVYSCPSPQELPPLQLPDYPPAPHQDSPEADIKDWYAEMVRVAKIRYEVVLTRMLILQEILDQYRPDPE
jgi:hypothetical protein